MQAILIEWPAEITRKIGKDISALQKAICNLKAEELTDTIMGYNSLVLKYNEELKHIDQEIELLKSIYKKDLNKQHDVQYCWEIPVCYNQEFGLDLEAVSTKSSLSVDEIIQLHSAQVYTVYFIGFLPGFLYLGGLDDRLILERKSNPRLRVEKGAVGIGGSQTGIYPNESAGGWNILGKTPISFFDINKEVPCFAKSGDDIQFVPVTMNTFKTIEKQVLADTYKLKKTVIND